MTGQHTGKRRDGRVKKGMDASSGRLILGRLRWIRNHLRRARLENILDVFQRIHLRFIRACGLASGRTSFASSRIAMSDRLLAMTYRLC